MTDTLTPPPASPSDKVHHVRYLLQVRALELFFADRSNVFLAFPSRRQAKEALLKLAGQHPGGLVTVNQHKKGEQADRLALQWRRRELSNFEYLMKLNTLAGRTYSDLSQYPVFPWVLRDYESAELDLEDPAAYRDLSKPMGAQEERQRAFFTERYAVSAEADPDTPAFHYGSHYSSAGAVSLVDWFGRGGRRRGPDGAS